MSRLRLNYLGVIGAILAFVSLVLPWWTMSISYSAMGRAFSGQLSVCPYQATATLNGAPLLVSLNLWFAWTALGLGVIGGLLGVTGSLIASDRRGLLALSGVLVLLSIIVFVVGLQNQLSRVSYGSLAEGYPPVGGLFSSGSYSLFGVPNINMRYSANLSFGLWLALVSAFIMFAALAISPAEVIPPSQPFPQPQTRNARYALKDTEHPVCPDSFFVIKRARS